MSDGVLTALVVTLPAIIAAVAAFLQSRRNGAAAAADAVEKKKSLDHITVMVNSRLTEALNEIAALKKIIAAIVPPDRDKAVAAADVAKGVDAVEVVSTIAPLGIIPIPIREYVPPAPPVPKAPTVPPGIP